jgi:divalent metal cation (Fe/Co/Zn/Cd) transporter
MYPAGRSRLEPVGIIVCAAIMGCAALQLILESGEQLATGFGSHAHHAVVSFNLFTIVLLLATVLAKLALWIYCSAYARYSPTLFTLAVDHRNDVLSNVVALIAALIAWKWSVAWSADPIGAILMSIYIVINWSQIALEHIEQVVGRAADPSFIEEVRSLSTNFHTQLIPDVIRAYHFGARYLVEVEVVLPADMSVRESHDIGLSLQQSIEQLPSVERAFVHIDWRSRGGEDEHNAEAIAIRSKLQAEALAAKQEN